MGGCVPCKQGCFQAIIDCCGVFKLPSGDSRGVQIRIFEHLQNSSQFSIKPPAQKVASISPSSSGRRAKTVLPLEKHPSVLMQICVGMCQVVGSWRTLSVQRVKWLLVSQVAIPLAQGLQACKLDYVRKGVTHDCPNNFLSCVLVGCWYVCVSVCVMALNHHTRHTRCEHKKEDSADVSNHQVTLWPCAATLWKILWETKPLPLVSNHVERCWTNASPWHQVDLRNFKEVSLSNFNLMVLCDLHRHNHADITHRLPHSNTYSSENLAHTDSQVTHKRSHSILGSSVRGEIFALQDQKSHSEILKVA